MRPILVNPYARGKQSASRPSVSSSSSTPKSSTIGTKAAVAVTVIKQPELSARSNTNNGSSAEGASGSSKQPLLTSSNKAATSAITLVTVATPVTKDATTPAPHNQDVQRPPQPPHRPAAPARIPPSTSRKTPALLPRPSTTTTTTPSTAPRGGLSLKQELEQLKRKQKLQMEQLTMHKAQKKERKRLKRLRQQQQQKEEEERRQLRESMPPSVTSVPATAETTTLLYPANTQGVPVPSVATASSASSSKRAAPNPLGNHEAIIAALNNKTDRSQGRVLIDRANTTCQPTTTTKPNMVAASVVKSEPYGTSAANVSSQQPTYNSTTAPSIAHPQPSGNPLPVSMTVAKDVTPNVSSVPSIDSLVSSQFVQPVSSNIPNNGGLNNHGDPTSVPQPQMSMPRISTPSILHLTQGGVSCGTASSLPQHAWTTPGQYYPPQHQKRKGTPPLETPLYGSGTVVPQPIMDFPNHPMFSRQASYGPHWNAQSMYQQAQKLLTGAAPSPIHNNMLATAPYGQPLGYPISNNSHVQQQQPQAALLYHGMSAGPVGNGFGMPSPANTFPPGAHFQPAKVSQAPLGWATPSYHQRYGAGAAAHHPLPLGYPTAMPQQQQRRPAPHTPMKRPHCLAVDPIRRPSPFALTHTTRTEAIVVTKSGTESFGMTLQLDMLSVLVDPPVSEVPSEPWKVQVANPPTAATDSGTATTAAAAPSSVNNIVKIAQRRKRRKRVFYSVMTVVDPSKQNIRHEGAPLEKLLQEGDILLTINGTTVSGLSFREACQLFRSCQSGPDGTARCPVTIARRNKIKPILALPPVRIVPLKSGTNPSFAPARTGPLDAQELLALVESILLAIKDPKRPLGDVISNRLLKQKAAAMPALTPRGEQTNMESIWFGMGSKIESSAKNLAELHWKACWSKEPDQIRSGYSTFPYLTDARRSVLRAAPRPAKGGCKCGAQDHSRVNDLNCPLYSNLRSLADAVQSDESSDELTVDSKQRKRSLNRNLPKDLNVVEKAFKDRVIRTKIEKEMDEAEARFVKKMEEIQLTKCKQAILAPMMSVMVLSAVYELQREFKSMQFSPLNVPKEKVASPERKKELEIDDDVPLAALGKRVIENCEETSSSKRARKEPFVRDMFLGRLVHLLGKKWGHVYSEPSHEEYSWRWEVYHGQAMDCDEKWNTSSNPRRPGTRSLERAHFVVNEEVASQLEQGNGVNKIEAIKSLVHILSPKRTGVFDELMALIRTEVVAVDENGIPMLAKNWWANIDLFILDDMHYGWGDDTSGRYGVPDKLRRILNRKWIRAYDGWAFTGYEEDIIHDFAEYDEWRAAYEAKQQARSDGVGRYK